MELVNAVTPFLLDRDFNYPDIPNRYLALIYGSSLSPHTKYSYALCLLHWLRWCEDCEISWQTCSPRDILRYQRAINGTNRTKNYKLARIRNFYQYATHLGIESPFAILTAGVNLVRLPVWKKQLRLPSIPDIGVFIKGLPSAYRIMAQLMLFCGLRREEIAYLKTDVLRKAQLTQTEAKLLIVGKGGHSRIIRMAREFYSRLLSAANGEFVFNHNGTGYSANSISNAFRLVARKLQMGIHPHLLRHCFATYRLKNLTEVAKMPSFQGYDAAVVVVQGELGHRNKATTHIYLNTMFGMTCPEVHSSMIDALVRGGVPRE